MNANENSGFSHPLFPSLEFITQKGVSEDLVGLYGQQYYRLAFGVSTWYQTIKEHTFESVFIDLDENIINQLINAFTNRKSSNNGLEKELNSLENSLDDAIHLFGNEGAFIKLESRSPKDAIFDNTVSEKIKNDIKEEIENAKIKNYCPKQQAVFDGFMKAIYKKNMKVVNGQQALKLLTMSHRVFEDLSSVKDFIKFELNTKIVLRRWDKILIDKPEMEFRAFVFKNQLNALSQYDYASCYPELVKNKLNIQEKIQSFFNLVLKEKLKTHETYILDLFVYGDSIKVIELNSFETWTGACLFSWAEDKNLLLNGPFSFRIVEKQPQENLFYMIPFGWRNFMEPFFNEVSKPSSNTNSSFPSCIII